MGKFAQDAAQHSTEHRGDGYCVAGRWIAENLDDEDIAELERLAAIPKWELICRISDYNLKPKSLRSHVYGRCSCHDGRPAKGCCTNKDTDA
jgi:hypothetical protein